MNRGFFFDRCRSVLDQGGQGVEFFFGQYLLITWRFEWARESINQYTSVY